MMILDLGVKPHKVLKGRCIDSSMYGTNSIGHVFSFIAFVAVFSFVRLSFTSVAVTSINGIPKERIAPRTPTQTPYEAIDLADWEPTGTSTKIAFALFAAGMAIAANCSAACKSCEFWRTCLPLVSVVSIKESKGVSRYPVVRSSQDSAIPQFLRLGSNPTTGIFMILFKTSYRTDWHVQGLQYHQLVGQEMAWLPHPFSWYGRWQCPCSFQATCLDR